MIDVVVQIGMVSLVAGIGMTLARMLRGPEVADRVLAADVLSLHVVGVVILLAVDQQRALSLDAALLVAIVGFASTLAFAQFIGGSGWDVELPDDRAGS